MSIPAIPIAWTVKDVLAALETVESVDPGLSGADAVRLWDVKLVPLAAGKLELPYVTPYYGAKPSILTGKHATLSGKIAVAGSGTAGQAPAWDAFMQASGTVRSQVAATASATIASAASGVATPHGSFTYARTTAFGGTASRTVTLTCTTGGASGSAKFTVSAPADGEVPAYSATAVTMTDASPFALPNGAVITPTVGTSFQVGDAYTIALSPARTEYRPITDRVQHKSLAVYFDIGTERHKLLGSRLTMKLSGQVSAYPYWDFNLTGHYAPPETIAPITPDFSDWPDPVEISGPNTPRMSLHGHDLVIESFGMDIGNKVSFIERVGRAGARIQDRKSTFSLTAEAPLLTDADFFALAEARAVGALTFQHGVTSGGIVRIDAAKAQLDAPDQKEASNDYMLDLSGSLLPTSGDDEWTVSVR